MLRPLIWIGFGEDGFIPTDNVDISLDGVTEFELDTKNPEKEKPLAATKTKEALEKDLTYQNNKKDLTTVAVERNEALKDFYNTYDQNSITSTDRENYKKYITTLDPKEKELIESKKHFYQLDFSNKGGLVMPLVLEFTFEDGTKQTERIPAEIWRLNSEKISKVFSFEKPIKSIVLDPNLETADVDTDNNFLSS